MNIVTIYSPKNEESMTQATPAIFAFDFRLLLERTM